MIFKKGKPFKSIIINGEWFIKGNLSTWENFKATIFYFLKTGRFKVKQ